ncbi:MAG: hypothetical protein ACI8RD_001968 [Bacillariaceae sp.]|jgi:hypothetical protein
MGATIIISFLSLMSFADFLRVLWQRPPEEQDEGEGEHNGGRENVGAGGDDNIININNNEDETDNDNASDERIVEIMKKHQQIEDDNDIDAIENDSLAPDDNNKKQSHDVTQIGTDQEVSDDRGHEAEQLLRDQATELRNLTIERESRQHNANVEQERIPLHDVLNEDVQNGEENGDDDDDDNDSVVPPVDVINARLNDEIEEDDDSDYVDDDDGDDNDNEDIDEADEADQDEIDEEDAWMEEVEDEDENDAVPPLEQPPGGDVAFDPLDPVLQDDQVVSLIYFPLCIFCCKLVQLTHVSLLRLPDLSIFRIWKSTSHWMNYSVFEALLARWFAICFGFWHSMQLILASLVLFLRQLVLGFIQAFSTLHYATMC